MRKLRNTYRQVSTIATTEQLAQLIRTLEAAPIDESAQDKRLTMKLEWYGRANRRRRGKS
jgi:hypothetical protein